MTERLRKKSETYQRPSCQRVVVSMDDKKLLRKSVDGTVSVHADLSSIFPGKANDMVVDDHGSAFVGNFGYESYDPENPVLSPTCVASVQPDGSVSVAAEDLHFPNGSVITPDGSTLIVGESQASRYTAFTIEPDGVLTDRRVWAQFDPTTVGGPDGCTLDAEEHIWMADPLGGPVRRAAPGGEIVDQIDPPAGMTICAVALGGKNGKTMLLCAGPAQAYEGRDVGAGCS